MAEIRMLTSMEDIDKFLREQLSLKERAMVNTLQAAGESAVNTCRRYKGEGDYIDRTGNLRSSTGYSVVANGTVVSQSNFQTIKKGADGSAKGKAFNTSILPTFTKGLWLIVSAGMSYAKYVSTVHHRDVLDSAEIQAKKTLKSLMQDI